MRWKRWGPLGWLILFLFLTACGEGGEGDGNRREPPTIASSPSPSQPLGLVTLAAVGDVMLGRTIGEGISQFGPLYPFEFVADDLRRADITFANLESPLTTGGVAAPKDFVFRGPLEGAKGVAQAGIDIVSLANNHTLDYGLEGLLDTRTALERAGVAYVGIGNNATEAHSPVVIRVAGLRLAFLAFVNTPPDSVSGFDLSSTAATANGPGLAWATVEAINASVTEALGQADVVIVSLHTGPEYQERPHQLQVALARAAVDAGASLVLGHHPHVLQGLERYKTGLITYSLGNFVFDFDQVDYAQPGLPSSLSAILQVQIGKEGVLNCQLLPIYIDPADGRPRPASEPEVAAIRQRMQRLSDPVCGL